MRCRRRIGLTAVSILAASVLGVAQAANHARAPVPASLKAAESKAEDIVDLALSMDRAKAAELAASLKATANGSAAAALTRAKVPATLVAQLRQRANRLARIARTGSFLNTALAANAVSELMPDLYGRFQDPVPAAVLKLDYLDREAHLRSLGREPEKVARAVAELGPTWARVRPKVIAAGGAKVAKAYQKHVAAMKRLAPDAGLRMQAEAVHGLALVDDLERVFLR